MDRLIAFLNDHWRGGNPDVGSLTVHWPPELVKAWEKLDPDEQKITRVSFEGKARDKGLNGIIGNFRNDYYCQFKPLK